jgi:hypothetical protein
MAAATFAGAQIARRALPNLGVGDTMIAAPIALALAAGVTARYNGYELDTRVLLPIGVSALAALAGALTSRHRVASSVPRWAVMAAGFSGFGGAVLAGGVGLVIADNFAVGGLIGALLGAFVATLCTPISARQSAIALGLVTAAGVGAASHEPVTAALGGFVIGWILGGIGGRIGETLRPEPGEEAELPEAQVR